MIFEGRLPTWREVKHPWSVGAIAGSPEHHSLDHPSAPRPVDRRGFHAGPRVPQQGGVGGRGVVDVVRGRGVEQDGLGHRGAATGAPQDHRREARRRHLHLHAVGGVGGVVAGLRHRDDQGIRGAGGQGVRR